MMAFSVERVLQAIEESYNLYYRLVLIVGPSGSGKTQVLREVSAAMSVPIINVNLELSRRMLELTARQRALRAQQLLHEIVADFGKHLALLDNNEILFDIHLKLDPLRALQDISRNKTIVATWNGSLVENFITYAEPEHREYRRCPMGDFLVISAEAKA